MTGFKEANLRLLVDQIGEQKTAEILSDFSCPSNEDVETFLRRKAILFAKNGFAATHLVFASYKNEPVLVGYYALANKTVAIKASDLNSRWRSRITKFAVYDEKSRSYFASLPLIGQLGKNYCNGYDRLITGDELLKLACDRIKKSQLDFGGKMAYLECIDASGLIRFYESNGFYRFANRNLDKDEIGEQRYLVQMIKYFSSKE